MVDTGYDFLIRDLRAFKRKFYLNRLIRGSIFFLALVFSLILLINSLEYGLKFDSQARTILFFASVIAVIGITYIFLADPIIKIWANNRQMSNEEAARQIGRYFPTVKDKLLNTIQLHGIGQSELIAASIRQKTKQLSLVAFPSAVDMNENRRYAKYLIAPGSVLLLVLIFIPQLLTESSNRLINFRWEFVPLAPFEFVLENKDLKAFKNEDFSINLRFEGETIPEDAYINTLGRKVKMKDLGQGRFEYTYQRIQYESDFFFEAAGFRSLRHELEMVSRPNLKDFNVVLNYPRYINQDVDLLENVGNLRIPEGTLISWQFNTFQADSMALRFGPKEEIVRLQMLDDQLFEYKRRVGEAQNYAIILKNAHSQNKDPISYFIDVVKDQYPQISLDQYRDTPLYQYIILGGNISDDYGLSSLKLFHRIVKNARSNQFFKPVNLFINEGSNTQSYFHQWDIESFDLSEGDNLEYYLEVWDNDGINGMKSSRTARYTFHVPSRSEIKSNIETSSSNAQQQIDQSLKEAQELKERLEDTEERLRGKKELSWQDEKLLEELLKDRKELEEELRKLREMNQAFNQQRERFSEQNDQLKQKVEQLQNLMDELLDEETKKLYEELQKLIEENRDVDQIQDMLAKLNSNEENLEKELERAIELFKRMKFESKLEEVITDLNQVAEEQEQLADETGDKKNDTEELLEKQKEISQEFEDLEQELEELEELNQDLQNPQPVQETSEEQQSIKQEQRKSQDNLENNKRKRARESQENASDQMKQMSQKLQQMQQGMEMTMLQQNLDHLRDIVDNLVKLSFSQEDLMVDFRKINQSDPRFVELSQQQLKIKDDARIVEDSLLSLANRVFQIQSFITREVGMMNDNIDASLEAIKERKLAQVTAKQQFAMTSVNNLAIMLDDILQQMHQQMADAMGKPQKGGKPQKSNLPSLSQLQQELNQKIEDLKKSGKQGRPLSEELAKLAAEQERLRQALRKMNDEATGEDGGKGEINKIVDKMEETEADLVNKNLTSETIKRQKEILTRLLEAEDALRERELDQEREAQHAQEYQPSIPKAFEEYIKAKEKEIELLKTVPVKLNPYYKKEVNRYFKRLESSSQ